MKILIFLKIFWRFFFHVEKIFFVEIFLKPSQLRLQSSTQLSRALSDAFRGRYEVGAKRKPQDKMCGAGWCAVYVRAVWAYPVYHFSSLQYIKSSCNRALKYIIKDTTEADSKYLVGSEQAHESPTMVTRAQHGAYAVRMPRVCAYVPSIH